MSGAIKYCFSWAEAYSAGAEKSGGKGWNLGRLARYGFCIPRGGVLSTRAYEKFLQTNHLNETIKNVSRETSDNLDDHMTLLDQLKTAIMTGTVPADVIEELTALLQNLNIADKALAVRSSASAEDSARASFAGVHDSFLNIRGMEKVLNSVKACYASLWSPQAVAYRRKLNISDHEVQAAIVIMEMVQSQASGVGFTCDPQTGREDIFIINANWGLGESVVGGMTDSDTYTLDVSPWQALPEVTEIKIGRKEGLIQSHADGGTEFIYSPELSSRQVLSSHDISRLGLIMLRVFESLGEYEQHQDIEWAYDGQNFILLQARPVTVLPRYTFEGVKNQEDIWSNGNYRDAVPMVISPFSRRLLKGIIDTMQYTSFTLPGYQILPGFKFSRFFNGRLYCNIAALQWCHYDSTGTLPQQFQDYWGGHQPYIEIDDPQPYDGLQGQQRMNRALKGVSLIEKCSSDAPHIYAQITEQITAILDIDFNNLPDQGFINLYERLGRIHKEYAEQYSFLSGAGTWTVISLLGLLDKYLGEQAIELLNGLMVGGNAAITSADHGYRLVELAKLARQDEYAYNYFTADDYAPLQWEQTLPENSSFKQSFRDFLNDYGHRAIYELDLINPRWSEDPSYFLDIIAGTMNTADISGTKNLQQEKYALAWKRIEENVPSEMHAEIKKAITAAQAGAATREMAKSILVLALKPYRSIAQTLGKRLYLNGLLETPEDVFYCSWPDLVSIIIGQWDGQQLKIVVADRKESHARKEEMAPPDVIIGEKPKFIESGINLSGECLIGVAAASGTASGQARLIKHPDEGKYLSAGEILIAPSTDPAWTPLFLKASAIVMETGGFLSHGAIVAREYGVPAVVNVAGVMRILKDGQLITVDGNHGKVFL